MAEVQAESTENYPHTIEVVLGSEIRMSILVEAGVDEVWKALSSQEALRNWFNDTIEVDPRQGGRIYFDGTNGTETYRVEGQITEWEPRERLSFEWPSGVGQPTVLSIELEQCDVDGGDTAQTTVTLRHHGFDELPAGTRDATFSEFQQRWNGDELIPLKLHVEGVGPSH